MKDYLGDEEAKKDLRKFVKSLGLNVSLRTPKKRRERVLFYSPDWKPVYMAQNIREAKAFLVGVKMGLAPLEYKLFKDEFELEIPDED